MKQNLDAIISNVGSFITYLIFFKEVDQSICTECGAVCTDHHKCRLSAKCDVKVVLVPVPVF